MTDLLNFIHHYQELDDKTEEAVRTFFKEEVYKKNEYILEEGKICSKISFIKSGLVRRFYIQEVSGCISTTNGSPLMPVSFIKSHPWNIYKPARKQ